MNSFSVSIYTLTWRKVCDYELNKIMVDAQENRTLNGFILDLLTAINSLCACNLVGFDFVLIRFVGWGSYVV